MGQIRSYDDALDFYPEAKAGLRSRFGGFAHKAVAYWDALVEGHAAARHYNELRARGLSHDVAASKVFSQHFG